MICILFSKGFFWSHLKTFARLQAKRHAKHPENYKEIIFWFNPIWCQNTVKNDNGTVSLPMLMCTLFHLCKWMHRLSWEKNLPKYNCAATLHVDCIVASEEARMPETLDAQAVKLSLLPLTYPHCLNFLYFMLLAGERKTLWSSNKRTLITWILHHADPKILEV